MIDDLIDRVSILGPTNTQTRRLGYVTQICKMLRDEPYPALNLIGDLETWAQANQPLLEKHISDKGVIRPSGRSLGAKRYVGLTKELELIIEASGYLRLTKTGRVLLSVNEQYPHDEPDNPFRLSPKEKLLLTYDLLLLDSDYLLPVLQLTNVYHKQLELQEQTQQALLKHFKTIGNNTDSPVIRSEAADRILALSGWKKAKKYSEHLALPRLHWLLDLELLDWRSFEERKEFVPSKAGTMLLNSMPRIEGEVFVNRIWCQNDLFAVWAKTLSFPSRAWEQLTTTRQRALIKTYVSIGFSHFRTMEYPRISAYQLVLFTVIRLLFCENVVAGFENIKQALSKYSDSSSDGWIFYWTEMDDDGYVLLPR